MMVYREETAVGLMIHALTRQVQSLTIMRQTETWRVQAIVDGKLCVREALLLPDALGLLAKSVGEAALKVLEPLEALNRGV
jgi:hypothetical protein